MSSSQQLNVQQREEVSIKVEDIETQVQPRIHVQLEPFGNPLKGEQKQPFDPLDYKDPQTSVIEDPDDDLGDSSIKLKQVQSKKKQTSNQIRKFKKREISHIKRFIKRMLSHKITQYFLGFLVFLYTILIFAMLTIDDLVSDKEEKKRLLIELEYFELSILIIFQIEIMLSSYAQGIELYFRDRWLLFDEIVIIASIILVLLDISVDYGSQFSSISGSIRGIFRFLRIFLLIRKIQVFKKIQTSGKFQTPAERIIDHLLQMREQFDSVELMEDIEWCMDMIQQNKLYDYDDLEGDQNENKEEQAWMTMNKANKIWGLDLVKLKSNYQKANEHQYPMDLIPSQNVEALKGLDTLDFDVFAFSRIQKNGQELLYLMIYLFNQNDLFSRNNINPKIFVSFVSEIQQGYQDNIYHNRLHAFDVAQTVNFFMKTCNFEDLAELEELDVAAIYIAAAAHDVGHPGFNNMYLINSQSNLALVYNDQSVLENMHCASTFERLKQEKFDITQNFSSEEKIQFRKILISIILATDMGRHFADISKAKGRLAGNDFEINNKDKQMCMDLVVHAADISNPLKLWSCAFEWTNRVLEEFWVQGDLEREQDLPITYLCDRYTVNIAKSQGGFISFLVKPLMEIVSNFLPEFESYLVNLDNNASQWEELVDQYDDSLKKLNKDREEKESKKEQKKPEE